MPYRRLPNTDAARIRAMRSAFAKGQKLGPAELAYSQEVYTRLGLFINSFESALSEYRTAYRRQSEGCAEYQQLSRRARLYVSHFIQALNMAIMREELKPEVRECFGLEREQVSVPSLVNDSDVEEWGQRIIDGEFTRTSQGRSPMQNPSVAMLRVHYEQFVDAYRSRRVLQQNTQRTLNALTEMRPEADAIILDVWNQVERFYSHLDPSQAREQAQEYGLTYVFRKNELRELEPGESLFSTEVRKTIREFRLRAGSKP